MNFVQLVENLRVECGVSGATITSVQNQVGELNRLKTWIIDAWQELQLERNDWKFMRRTISFTLQPGIQRYTLATVQAANAAIDIDLYKQDSFTIDVPLGNHYQEQPLGVMNYDHFRDMYINGYPITDMTRWQRPMTMAFEDDKSILFGPAPDAAYIIRGQCYINPQVLSADTDVPIMPAKYHKVIVYRAMKKYAGYESANDVRVRALQEGRMPELTLFNEQLPQMVVDGGFDGYNEY